ncbi:unnamed protein product [Arctia plantaginis]|uniref:Lipocalin/cytosolic fatty-acid binding domain-containing protein n=1 Tax=Arctia plantaginis TaxID=874455 RepID=A0A8S0YUP5_ARCPL|nr:unnamed protein product [Arctia plantaginis]
MEECLGKSYVLVNSENLEDFFIFIGVGYLARKAAVTLKQTVRITRNEDGSYKFEFISPLKIYEFVFTPGEEFEEVRPDGVKMKSVATIEGNKMTHTQTDPNGRKCIHVREFYGEKMITTTTGEGLDKIVKRYYEAR